MAAYLISERKITLILKAIKKDDQALIILLGEGAYLGLKPWPAETIFCLKDSALERGLNAVLPSNVQLIDYDQVIKLIADQQIYCY